MKLLCRSLETNQLAILDSKSKAKHFNAFEQGADESIWRFRLILISGFSISNIKYEEGPFSKFFFIKIPKSWSFFETTSDFEKP